MWTPKVHLREGGRFFPNAARSFHRNDPKIFLRVLEDVWKNYKYGRRYILTLKKFYRLENSHEKQHFLLHFWYLQTPFGVSIKLQKLLSFHVFLPKNVFMHVIDLKMFSTCFLNQGKHVTYRQHDIICHRSISNAV